LLHSPATIKGKPRKQRPMINPANNRRAPFGASLESSMEWSEWVSTIIGKDASLSAGQLFLRL